MRKAQAELDAVVGQGQVPTFEDKDDLPYTQAVVREILRWRPPAPLVGQALSRGPGQNTQPTYARTTARNDRGH